MQVQPAATTTFVCASSGRSWACHRTARHHLGNAPTAPVTRNGWRDITSGINAGRITFRTSPFDLGGLADVYDFNVNTLAELQTSIRQQWSYNLIASQIQQVNIATFFWACDLYVRGFRSRSIAGCVHTRYHRRGPRPRASAVPNCPAFIAKGRAQTHCAGAVLPAKAPFRIYKESTLWTGGLGTFFKGVVRLLKAGTA
jgi:hypothetical protein